MKLRHTTKDGSVQADRREVISAIEDLAGDMKVVGPRAKEAELGLVEGLSRHLSL